MLLVLLTNKPILPSAPPHWCRKLRYVATPGPEYTSPAALALFHAVGRRIFLNVVVPCVTCGVSRPCPATVEQFFMQNALINVIADVLEPHRLLTVIHAGRTERTLVRSPMPV